jgi:hypothetical protein
MRIFDPKTGKSYFRKTRRRVDEPGQARELVFSCYHRYQFLNRDRTRLWFLEELEAARREWSFDYGARYGRVHPRQPRSPRVGAEGRGLGMVERALVRWDSTRANRDRQHASAEA